MLGWIVVFAGLYVILKSPIPLLVVLVILLAVEYGNKNNGNSASSTTSAHAKTENSEKIAPQCTEVHPVK